MNRAKTQRHSKKSKRGAGKQGSRKNTANSVGARGGTESSNSGPGKVRRSKQETDLDVRHVFVLLHFHTEVLLQSQKQKLKLQQLVSPSSTFQSVPDNQCRFRINDVKL